MVSLLLATEFLHSGLGMSLTCFVTLGETGRQGPLRVTPVAFSD